MSLKIRPKSSSCYHQGEGELFYHWISGLGILKHSANVVHWFLVPCFFKNEHRRDGMRCYRQIQEQRVSWRWNCHDWRRGQIPLQLLKCLFICWSPVEPSVLSDDSEEGGASIADPRNEADEGRNPAVEALDLLDILRRDHVQDGLYLVSVRLNPSLRDNYTKKFARGDAECTLLGVELDVEPAQVAKGLFDVGQQ